MRKIQSMIERFVTRLAPCPQCSGSGQGPGGRCTACNGSGQGPV